MKDLYGGSPTLRNLSPIHWVALVNIGLFGLLAIKTAVLDTQALILGVAMTVVAYGVSIALTQLKMGDTYIFSIVSMLVSIGLVMQYRLSPATGFKQFIWFLAGIAFFMTVYALYRHFNDRFRSVWLFYGLIVASFLATIVLGTALNGARNWIVIGGFTFQPSEFIKILFVFLMAVYVTNPDSLRLKWKQWSIHPRWTLMGMVFSILGLFAIQKELGTALLVFLIYLSFLYAFERGFWFPAANVALAGVGGLGALKVMHHLQVRVDTWLDPWADVSGKGYQITQSLFAIGSGSFFGSGLGLGHPEFIPAVNTDFIFAAICEEMGIFGGIAVILLFFLLVYRGVKIALRLKDRYNKAVAFGLTMMMGYQTFIIIGGVIKMIPLTGITLPFVSYGGSSLVSSYIALGILQALSGHILRREAAAHETRYNQ